MVVILRAHVTRRKTTSFVTVVNVLAGMGSY